MLMASECLAGILILIRRRGEMDTRPYPLFIAVIGSTFPWIITPEGSQVSHPFLAGLLMFTGLCLTISSKICLARSFGVIPANRGIKREGPYRLVRHPMYLGYIINQFGFLLACFSIWNLVVYLIAWVLLALRILEEERILQADQAYGDYSARTRWRLIPGLF
jgi:protein-S-isoprenylcysteine O-methyltransferase Ste14